ncbi:TonB-linked SusC/RagA family outer membrane protein [Chitinophaga skermanii]|uniref:TonB-linked SusC/RagA family outer membrane protein n=1 Tax=Chitinophaga skermanii TaxID=331697 RepID=A0A327R4I2_9BACT|nr:TonB-dependent receptor [Chitinophaga skermanii]RAJ10674.1 TonB-linked SusC/RagA family outer membrane protein [Chitinophaga skermanii]
MRSTKIQGKKRKLWQYRDLPKHKNILLLAFATSCIYLPGTAFSKNQNTNHFVQQNQVALTIKGAVKDKEGHPMPAVSIAIKGTGKGTITDANGNFSLNATKGDILEFSLMGYKVVRVTVGNDTNLTITMESDVAALNEVMIVGFGTQKKADLTGAVAQIGAERLQNRPIANVGQALQGVMPNLNITVGNGKLNTKPSYNIRGGTSIGLNSDNQWEVTTGSPLILVDGVPMDINQLNPEDIESVTMLKDASAAAIYGARGAFGVLLVKTKSGKRDDRVRVDYSNSFQWSHAAAVPNLLDAATIQQALVDAETLENRSPSTDMLAKLDSIKAYMADPLHKNPWFMNGNNIVWIGNVNPYKEALRDYAPMQKHNLSFSGGNAKTSFYASLGYQGQEGLFTMNTEKQNRYNVMLNLTTAVNDWFKIDFRNSYNNSTYTEPVSPSGKGGWWTAMAQEPGRNVNMPIKTPANSPVGVMYTDNILAFMDYGSTNKTKDETTLITVSPTLTPVKGWNIKSDLSYKSYNNGYKTVVPQLRRIENNWTNPTTAHTNPDYVDRYTSHSNQYTINLYTDYTRTINQNHNLYGLVGFNQEWYTDESLYGKRENLLSPGIPVIDQSLGNQYADDSESHWAVRGIFYRLMYNYKNKYFVQSNGRYDGTSRFPSDRRYKLFPSVSAGWRITEEGFAEGIKNVINDFKIRGSYGSLGNQNVANYIYIPTYGTTSQISYLLNGIRPPGITPPGLVDANLTWETATTIDFGFDMVAFKNWEVNFDYYKRRTKDILTPGTAYPSVLGTSAPTQNVGELLTTGWELTTKYHNTTSFGLNYNVAFTLGDYQSEVVKFEGNPNKQLSTLYAGQKLGEIWGYVTEGIFQTQKEIDEAPIQSAIQSGLWFPGDIRYKNLNGDTAITNGANTVDNPGDRRIIGNSTPRFQFGVNIDLQYKGFDFNMFLQGIGKRDVWIGNSLYWGAGSTGTWEVYNNSWTPDRTGAYYPAYKNKAGNRQVQTRYLENGAYLRMKNISLGYTVPKNITERIKLSRVRVYAAAYNLFQISKLPSTFDPELLSSNYPILKSLAAGIQVSF